MNGLKNYGVQLEQLDSIKNVNFDLQLKFYKHIDNKINKTYSFLGKEKFYLSW